MFSLARLARGVGMTFIISPGFLVAASVPDLPLTATDELLHAIRAGPATTKILGKSSTATLERRSDYCVACFSEALARRADQLSDVEWGGGRFT